MAGRERKVLEERVGRRLAETQVLLTKEVVLWSHGYLAMPQVPHRSLSSCRRPVYSFIYNCVHVTLLLQSDMQCCVHCMSLCSSARNRLNTSRSKVPEALRKVEYQ